MSLPNGGGALRGIGETFAADDLGAQSTSKDSFSTDPALPGIRRCPLVNIPLPTPTGTFAVDLSSTAMDDLWLAVRWADV